MNQLFVKILKQLLFVVELGVRLHKDAPTKIHCKYKHQELEGLG